MKTEPRQPAHIHAEAIAVCLVLLFVVVQLFWPPMVGQASNGDFERLMQWGKFEYVTADYDEKYFNWINREFRITKSPWLAWYGFGSSEIIFIKLSAVIGDWIFAGDGFDLRLLGFIHVLAYAAAFWLLMKGWRAATGRSSLCLLPGFLLFFCDLGYTAYFNSFYSEPSSLIFLLAMTGAGFCLTAQRKQTTSALALFCFCAGLFIAAKPQNFVMIPPLLLFCARLFQLDGDKVRRGLIAAFACSLVSAAILLNVIAPWYTHNGRYQSIFYGILKDSPSPEQDLRNLGLDENLAVLANTTVFHANLPIDIKSQEFAERFYRRVNHLKIAQFYLTHPARLMDKLRLTAENAYSLQLYLGNYEKASGLPARSLAHRWSWWSDFKQSHWPKSLWLFVGWCLAILVFLSRGYRRASTVDRLAREFCLMLWVMLLLAFITPMLGDGHSDLQKHLFLFNALFDLSLLLLFGLAVERLWRVAAGVLQSRTHSESIHQPQPVKAANLTHLFNRRTLNVRTHF